MSRSVKDSFLDLERHRQLLEENIAKLKKSLQHWQTWEAEYEGLKEEILATGPTSNHEQLAVICGSYEGELLDSKEIAEILGGKSQRTADQVINVLEKRIDYVHQNVETIEKQIEKAEDKLATATIISNPDVRNEEGLPMTEIVEELDDDGNVISSHTTTPGSAGPQLLEALKKAGVTELLDNKAPVISKEAERVTEYDTPSLSVLKRESEEKALPDTSQETTSKATTSASTKKSVRFTEDTTSAPDMNKSANARRIESIMNDAKMLEEKPLDPPVIPTDESAEDAQLRREMLRYGMSEVGAVVAELNIEEGSDWSDDDYEMEETSSSEEEDEFGRSTRRVVDDDLRQRMRELEERLGVRSMENVGKNPDHYDIVKEGIGRITIKGEDTQKTNQATPVQPEEATKVATEPGKKNVRFSEHLDISPAPLAQTQSPSPLSTTSAAPAAVGDIVERKAPSDSANAPGAKKQSRFKSARAVVNGPLAGPSQSSSAPALPLFPASSKASKVFSTPIQFAPVENHTRTVPTGPEGMTLAPTVVEREVPKDAQVPEPDELDPQLLHQEVAVEYHRRRNQMIQKQGGFLKKEESEIVPLEEEEGGPKKLSRFKAARLAMS